MPTKTYKKPMDVSNYVEVMQVAGIEVGVHATRELFAVEEDQATLLVDASNALDSLNRQTAFHNVRRICPIIAKTLINTYKKSTELFIDGNSLLSQEGTTQGDPLLMAI